MSILLWMQSNHSVYFFNRFYCHKTLVLKQKLNDEISFSLIIAMVTITYIIKCTLVIIIFTNAYHIHCTNNNTVFQMIEIKIIMQLLMVIQIKHNPFENFHFTSYLCFWYSNNKERVTLKSLSLEINTCAICCWRELATRSSIIAPSKDKKKIHHKPFKFFFYLWFQWIDVDNNTYHGNK